MTNRERMLGILRGTEVDRVPFVMYSGMAAPNDEVWSTLGRDAVGILKWSSAVSVQTPSCTRETETIHRDGLTGQRDVISTSSGKIYEERYRSPALGALAASKHFVQEPEEYRILLAYLRDIRAEPNLNSVQADADELGEDGIPLVAVHRTPYQQMWIQWARVNRLCEDLADEDSDLLECMAEIERVERDVMRSTCAVAEEIDIPLIDFPDNIHAPVIGKSYFRQFCIPLYRELAHMLSESTSIPACHMDGDLKTLWSDIAGSGIQAIDSLSPLPDNDTSVSAAIDMWPDMRLLVNFPSSVHLAEPKTIYETAMDLLVQGGHTGRMWVQVSEDTPPGRWKVSFPKILEAIREYGSPSAA